MRCLRVRLVTGVSEAQGISRDDNTTVPRGRRRGFRVDARLCEFAKAPKGFKSRAERQGASPCPQGCGFRAQGADEDLTYSPSRRSAPFGETEKEKRRRPGAQLNRMRSVGSGGLFDIVKRVRTSAQRVARL
jgi:hypothetical protein